MMSRYWQPCKTSQECAVDDNKLECVRKMEKGSAVQWWCDCVNGWDLREGWCVNVSFTEKQKIEFVRQRQLERMDKLAIIGEEGGEIKFLIIFLQIAMLVLGGFLTIVCLFSVLKKILNTVRVCCKSRF